MNESLTDHRIWLLIFMIITWSGRARRATRTQIKVPMLKPASSISQPLQDKVSVIIPAKNEEKNIGDCLEKLLAQDYPHLEIIVANDNSSDRTEEILKSFGSRIKTLNVPPTPPDWTGKNYALHTALPLASGSWYLFTDADTRHDPASISTALTHAITRKIELLTLLPRCIALTFFEKLIQPTAMGFMGLWFPFEKVNNPKSREYFGNGQYILMRRELYGTIGGHHAVRHEFLEDYGMVRRAKEKGAKIQVAFGTRIYGTRMYDSLTRIWRGWRRIYLHAFRQNALKLGIRAVSVLLFSVVPFLAAIPTLISVYTTHPANSSVLLGLLVSLLLFIFIIAWRTYSMIKANRLYAFLHPAAAVVIGMILIDAAIMAATKKETTWR
jgi:glycosyltransferase involved in cell wall biosynthesis